MGYIISFIKKILGVKEIITGLLIVFQISFYTAVSFFIVELIVVLFDIYKYIRQLFNNFTSGTLAGSTGGNDFNAVAWSMLNSYGVLDVFNIFLPLIFTTLTIYILFFTTRLLLDFKSKVLDGMYRIANLFVG